MSGAPLHMHMGAVNMMPFGEKRWFLLPPRDGVYTREQVGRWLLGRGEQLLGAPLMCTQQSGDAVFVPDLWSHGLVNT